jgi:hypothetical protein
MKFKFTTRTSESNEGGEGYLDRLYRMTQSQLRKRKEWLLQSRRMTQSQVMAWERDDQRSSL